MVDDTATLHVLPAEGDEIYEELQAWHTRMGELIESKQLKGMLLLMCIDGTPLRGNMSVDAVRVGLWPPEALWLLEQTKPELVDAPITIIRHQ